MASLSFKQREGLLEGPAGPPPPEVYPNFVNPPNLQAVGRGIILIGWSLAFICFAIRTYTRAFIIRHFNISDYAMILAWALSIAYFPVAWIIGDIAPGIDQWNLQLKGFISLLYWFHIGLILYSICIFFIKLSILRQFLEVFSLTQDYFFWTCHCLVWLNLIYYTILTFTVIFSCRPISKAWDVLITNGTCLNTEVQIVIAGIINTLSDLIILVLPHLKIWKLQMSPRRKRAVSVVFLFGIIACTGAALKIHYGLQLYNTTNNTSYQLYLLGLCTIPEISGGIIAGCLPSVPRFFQHTMQTPLVSSWKVSLSRLISVSASLTSSSLGPEVAPEKKEPKPKHFFGSADSLDERYPP
ncbi:uncharacterized protein KD926_002902 [Aspergillus affinis]|uniref:uncharacterized protein n=1 Tax=Aspergillus affinis TaxID=1070780 RepID=UPI0022FE3C33|nr:uncharacterized protein KD926_002902 [Aspergillus affinis]KAI9035798.1 hypothetical protein KD926_002902 [Aspergillus affinis]